MKILPEVFPVPALLGLSSISSDWDMVAEATN